MHLNNLTYGYADLHIHTTASDGVATIREVLDHIAAQKKLNVIAITDHDCVDAALWALEHQDDYDFDIVPGVEVSSRIGHVLGLWVTGAIPPNMSLEETTQAIHDQNGLAILAHPYHIHMGIVAKNFFRYTMSPEVLSYTQLDGIEVHNAGIALPGMNRMAQRLATTLHIAALGNSDAHTLGGIASGVTRFPGSSAADLRQAIDHAQTFAEGRSWPLIDYWIYSRNSTHNRSKVCSGESLSSAHLTHR